MARREPEKEGQLMRLPFGLQQPKTGQVIGDIPFKLSRHWKIPSHSAWESEPVEIMLHNEKGEIRPHHIQVEINHHGLTKPSTDVSIKVYEKNRKNYEQTIDHMFIEDLPDDLEYFDFRDLIGKVLRNEQTQTRPSELTSEEINAVKNWIGTLAPHFVQSKDPSSIGHEPAVVKQHWEAAKQAILNAYTKKRQQKLPPVRKKTKP